MAAEWFPVERADVIFLRPFTLMPLTLVTSFLYLDDLAVMQRLVISCALVLAGFLFISVLLSGLLRTVGRPKQPRVAACSEAPGFLSTVQHFGDGLGIGGSEWQLVESDAWTVVAPMPGDDRKSLVAISVENTDAPVEPSHLTFYGRQESGRLLASTLTQLFFPFRSADVFFDRTCSPKRLWEQHRTRLGAGGEAFTFEEFVSLHPKENLLKEAGFVRFALSWPRCAWASSAFVRGRDVAES